MWSTRGVSLACEEEVSGLSVQIQDGVQYFSEILITKRLLQNLQIHIWETLCQVIRVAGHKDYPLKQFRIDMDQAAVDLITSQPKKIICQEKRMAS
ncbi:hypothetical protein ACFL4I_00880 [Pseudomonadota bacterium]